MKTTGITLENCVAVVWANQNRVAEIVRIVKNIAERKITEERARNSEDLIEDLIVNSGIETPVVVEDKTGELAKEILLNWPVEIAKAIPVDMVVKIAKALPEKAVEIAKALPEKAVEIAKALPDRVPEIANAVSGDVMAEIVKAFKLDD